MSGGRGKGRKKRRGCESMNELWWMNTYIDAVTEYMTWMYKCASLTLFSRFCPTRVRKTKRSLFSFSIKDRDDESKGNQSTSAYSTPLSSNSNGGDWNFQQIDLHLECIMREVCFHFSLIPSFREFIPKRVVSAGVWGHLSQLRLLFVDRRKRELKGLRHS